MKQQRHGFALIEYIFALSIIIISATMATAALQSFLYTHQASSTMLQLQQSISLARSIAIAQNCHVTISYFGTNNSLTIKINNHEIKQIKLNIGKTDSLTLHQSGFDNTVITVTQDGMTYSNGHFNYKSQKSNSLPHFNLYFNKALRTYVLRSSNNG